MKGVKAGFAVMCIAAIASFYWFQLHSHDFTKKTVLSFLNFSRVSFQGWFLTNASWSNVLTQKEVQATKLAAKSSVYINHKVKYNRNRTAQPHDTYHKILWWHVPGWLKSEHWDTYCSIAYCEYTNCVITTDHKQTNESSAIIISITGSDKPSIPVSPLNRNPDQVWIFFSLEPPPHHTDILARSKEWHNIFNWSMTYHSDSDIFLPYGFLQQRENPPDKNYTDIFRKKTRQVAWIVSHCSTHSKREQYIRQLRKYIPVDTYGGCGKRLPDEKLYALLSEYKFYLAFENALCRDYVTEKFFYYFQYDIIIVTRALNDFKKHLPNNTFVNSADFASIGSLGKHLLRLGNNETEYIKYLKNTDQYTMLPRWDNYCDALCTICERLNNINHYRRSYGNILDFIGACASPKDLH